MRAAKWTLTHERLSPFRGICICYDNPPDPIPFSAQLASMLSGAVAPADTVLLLYFSFSLYSLVFWAGISYRPPPPLRLRAPLYSFLIPFFPLRLLLLAAVFLVRHYVRAMPMLGVLSRCFFFPFLSDFVHPGSDHGVKNVFIFISICGGERASGAGLHNNKGL